MADRDVTADVIVNDKTGPGFDSAARKAKKFGDDVDKVTKSTEGRFKALSGKISDGLTGGLAKAVTGIGAAATKLGIKAGSNVAEGLSSSIQGAGPQVQGAVTAVLVGAAASAAPLVAATFAGAVTSAAALGGLTLGLFALSKDPRVAQAGTATGATFMAGLTSAARPLLEPVLRSLQLIQQASVRVTNQLRIGFSGLSRYIVPFTESLIAAGEAITQGIVASMQKAGPLLLAIGAGAKLLGETIRDVLVRFAQLGPEAALAFGIVFKVVSLAIKVIADFVYAIVKVGGAIVSLGGLIDIGSGKVDNLGTQAGDTATDLSGLIPKLTGTGTAASGAATGVSGLTTNLGLLGNEMAQVDASQIALNTALENAKTTREGGITVTDNERQALLNLRTAIDGNITALENSGESAETVNAKVNTLRESFIQQAIQMGYNQSDAEELANKYGLFPRVVPTDFKQTGVEASKGNLSDIIEYANQVPRTIDIAIRVTGSSASRSAIAAALNKQSMAADAWGAHAESFAAANGFGSGSLSGSRQRQRPIELTNKVDVLLDGRVVAPTSYAIARQVSADERWYQQRTKR